MTITLAPTLPMWYYMLTKSVRACSERVDAMDEHIIGLRRQYQKLERACRRGLSAELISGTEIRTVDMLMQICAEIDHVLPYVTGTGQNALYSSAETEAIRKRMQNLPWDNFYRQVGAQLAKDAIQAVKNIPSDGYPFSTFRRLHNFVEEHHIYDWSGIGVSPQMRRILERLAQSDIAPGDIDGWRRRLEQLQVETADL